ncbi:hypothetical protein Ancab_027677 [Ancistrocladus abbreviatus]
MKHVHDKNRHAVTFFCGAPITHGVFLDQGVVLGGRVGCGSSSEGKVKCRFDHLPPEQQEREKACFSLNMACNYIICSMQKPAIQKVAIEDDDMLSSTIRISSRKQQEALKRVPQKQMQTVFEVPLPEKTLSEAPMEIAAWKWSVRKAKKISRERHALRCDTELKLSVAQKMRDEEGFNYPHNVDFRGRAYPMHPHLNHLSSDLCRGLLELAEGQPLGKSGLHWLEIHLANVYAGGINKLSYEGRLAFVENHLEDIFDSANNPINGNRWWLTAEDPFQRLATCINLSEALNSSTPDTFISHLPIHQPNQIRPTSGPIRGPGSSPQYHCHHNWWRVSVSNYIVLFAFVVPVDSTASIPPSGFGSEACGPSTSGSNGYDGVTKGKFTVAYYSDEEEVEEREDDDEWDEGVVRGCWRDQESKVVDVMTRLRMEHMGWHKYQDLKVLDGSVVWLWEERERNLLLHDHRRRHSYSPSSSASEVAAIATMRLRLVGALS